MCCKKITSLFLAVLLLVSNFGLAVNVHYCGGKIAAVSSAFTTIQSIEKPVSSFQECCCIKKGDKKNECCKNKVVDLKKETKEVAATSFSFQIEAPFVVLVVLDFVITNNVPVILSEKNLQYYCSPNAPPLFKLFHQYILYA